MTQISGSVVWGFVVWFLGCCGRMGVVGADLVLIAGLFGCWFWVLG